MSYKSKHTGEQIDTGVSAALNPDTAVTPSSTALVTSGAVDKALGGIKGIYPCTTSTSFSQINAALAAGKLPVLTETVEGGYTIAYVYSNSDSTAHQFVLAGWSEYFSEGSLVSGGLSVSMMICSSASVWTQKEVIPAIAAQNGNFTLKATKTNSGVTYSWAVDDVVEGYFYDDKFYADAQHTTEITAATGKIYIDLPTGYSYRWGGSEYVNVNAAYAPLASPALTGTPTAPTAASGTNTTQLATTEFVSSAIGDRIFIVEYGTTNPTSDYDKIAAAIASGFAVLCRFRLDTSTPVYYYAPLTEKRTLSGKEWYVFESVLNNNQTSGWSNIFGAALLQRRILKKIDNTCSWALETVALPCPDAPTGNGNYKLRLMKTRNGTTYSWVSDT